MAQRDLVAVRRIVGQVLGQRVIDRELAALGEQQDRGGGELLRDRADAEHRLLVGRDRELEIGRASGLRVHHLVATRDRDREPDRALAVHRCLHDRVGARGVRSRVPSGGRDRGLDEEQDAEERSGH